MTPPRLVGSIGPGLLARVLTGAAAVVGLAAAGCGKDGTRAPSGPTAPPTAAPAPTPTSTPSAAPAPAAPGFAAAVIATGIAGAYQVPSATQTSALPAGPVGYVFVSADGSIRVGKTAGFADARPVRGVGDAILALKGELPPYPPPPPPPALTEGRMGARETSPAPSHGTLGAAAEMEAGAFASITGTGDLSSGFDDLDIEGGLIGQEGEMRGGFGFGRSGFGPGGGGTGAGGLGLGTPSFLLVTSTTAPSAEWTVVAIDAGVGLARVARVLEALPGPAALVVEHGGEARALLLTVAPAGLPVGASGDAFVGVPSTGVLADLVTQLDAAVAGGARQVGVQIAPPPRRLRAPAAPQVRIGAPDTEGALDKAIIRRYIKRTIAKISFCYEKALLDKPTLQGTVTTTFVIGPRGLVTSAAGEGVDPAVAACVVGVIKLIEFPKPKGGASVNVRYPFTFRPAGD